MSDRSVRVAPMGLVAGKVVFVTGAGNGIGRATALCLAREGAAAVVVADLDETGAADTVRAIESFGGTAAFVNCDVAEDDQVAAAISQTVEWFGRIDGAFNNAGLGHGQAEMADIGRAGWDRTVAVNLTGTWLCMKYLLPQMVAQGGGAIVNQSSATAMGFPLVAGYGATKAAVAHLSKVAAVEYASRGIRVNALAAGPIATDMVTRAIAANPTLAKHLEESVPLGRIGTPDEVADTVVWLLSDRSSYITGTVIPVDGGQSVKG